MSQKQFKKHTIYKHDKWNMLTVEVHGSKMIAREISDQWGEDTHEFLSRPALHSWAESRYSAQSFTGSEEDRQAILEAIRQV